MSSILLNIRVVLKNIIKENIHVKIFIQISVEELLEKLNKPKEGFACNKCNKVLEQVKVNINIKKDVNKLIVFEEKKNDNQKIQDLENELKLMKELFMKIKECSKYYK